MGRLRVARKWSECVAPQGTRNRRPAGDGKTRGRVRLRGCFASSVLRLAPWANLSEREGEARVYSHLIRTRRLAARGMSATAFRAGEYPTQLVPQRIVCHRGPSGNDLFSATLSPVNRRCYHQSVHSVRRNLAGRLVTAIRFVDCKPKVRPSGPCG